MSDGDSFSGLFRSLGVVIESILSNCPLRNRGQIRVFHAATSFASYEFPWDTLGILHEGCFESINQPQGLSPRLSAVFPGREPDAGVFRLMSSHVDGVL